MEKTLYQESKTYFENQVDKSLSINGVNVKLENVVSDSDSDNYELAFGSDNHTLYVTVENEYDRVKLLSDISVHENFSYPSNKKQLTLYIKRILDVWVGELRVTQDTWLFNWK